MRRDCDCGRSIGSFLAAEGVSKVFSMFVKHRKHGNITRARSKFDTVPLVSINKRITHSFDRIRTRDTLTSASGAHRAAQNNGRNIFSNIHKQSSFEKVYFPAEVRSAALATACNIVCGCTRARSYLNLESRTAAVNR